MCTIPFLQAANEEQIEINGEFRTLTNHIKQAQQDQQSGKPNSFINTDLFLYDKDNDFFFSLGSVIKAKEDAKPIQNITEGRCVYVHHYTNKKSDLGNTSFGAVIIGSSDPTVAGKLLALQKEINGRKISMLAQLMHATVDAHDGRENPLIHTDIVQYDGKEKFTIIGSALNFPGDTLKEVRSNNFVYEPFYTLKKIKEEYTNIGALIIGTKDPEIALKFKMSYFKLVTNHSPKEDAHE